MTRVKICGITRKEDLHTAVKAGAHALGFVFYGKSPRHVSADQAEGLLAALPPFVTSVGLFVDAPAEQVRQILASAPLDMLQFHGDEAPEYCASFGRPWLKAVRVKPGVDLVQYAARYGAARGLLLDAFVEGTPGGTGQSFDWGLIPASLALPLVLSGGLSPANVAQAIRQVKPWAVDVSSGVEAAKGIKDAEKIAAFMLEVKGS